MFRCSLRFALKLKVMPNRGCSINYIQGQTPDPNSREYFYYIDHQGMLFLDDTKMKNFTSCFKDKKFLRFFFRRLKINDTGKYKADFPYISPCGVEKNYVRCDDLPVVFTNVLEIVENNKQIDYLSYGHAGELLKMKFEPNKICMLPENGRVYHPGPEATGGVGLVKSSLAILLSSNFIYKNASKTDDMPSFLVWKNEKYELTNELVAKLNNIRHLTDNL